MQLQFRGLLFLLLAPLATLAAEPSSDAQALTLEAAVEQALLKAPQLAAQVASHDAAQALTDSAGRLPDPQLVVGLDNLPVTGADAYSTTQDFMTMRRIGVMQEFPAAQKRRLHVTLPRRKRASPARNSRRSDSRSRAKSRTRGSGAAPPPPLSQACRHSSRIWSCRPLRPRRQSSPGVARPPRRSPRRPPLFSLRIGSSGCRARSDALCSNSSAGSVRMRCDRSGRCPRSTSCRSPRRRCWLPCTNMAPCCPSMRAPPRRGSTSSSRRRIGVPTGARNWPTPNVAPTSPTWFPSRFASACRCSRESPGSCRRSEGRGAATHRGGSGIRGAHAHGRIAAGAHGVGTAGRQIGQYERELLPLARERSRAALAAYRAGQGDLRLALDAFQQEIESLIEHASLTNERGRVWAYLRYLAPQPHQPQVSTP